MGNKNTKTLSLIIIFCKKCHWKQFLRVSFWQTLSCCGYKHHLDTDNVTSTHLIWTMFTNIHRETWFILYCMSAISPWAAAHPDPEFKNNLVKKPNRIYEEFKHLPVSTKTHTLSDRAKKWRFLHKISSKKCHNAFKKTADMFGFTWCRTSSKHRFHTSFISLLKSAFAPECTSTL